MKFGFEMSDLFPPNEGPNYLIDSRSLPRSTPYQPRGYKPTTKEERLMSIIDSMGEASAKSQGLHAVITTYSRLLFSGHRLYLRAEDNEVIGFIKVGEKNLFHRDISGKMRELTPVCVLDFYVHESKQRSGFGKEIFEFMLEKENKIPAQLAIDRPSQKFLKFLQKHYGLSRYISQSNNFVIFDQYFEVPNKVIANEVRDPKVAKDSNSLRNKPKYEEMGYNRDKLDNRKCGEREYDGEEKYLKQPTSSVYRERPTPKIERPSVGSSMKKGLESDFDQMSIRTDGFKIGSSHHQRIQNDPEFRHQFTRTIRSGNGMTSVK